MFGSESFTSAAQQLYAGPPGTFVARRTEAARLARENGDRELADLIKALRRPTASAALVNALPDSALEDICDLAHRMRAATSKMAVEELRQLTHERAKVVGRIVDPLSATLSVKNEVRATLLAAIADPAAEAAVTSRTLIRALNYSGFGEVELNDAVAVTPPQLRIVRDEREVDDARQAVSAAEKRLAAAQEAFAAADSALKSAESGLHAARHRLHRLESNSES